MGQNTHKDVGKTDFKGVPFVTLQTRRKLEEVNCRKDVWDCYYE